MDQTLKGQDKTIEKLPDIFCWFGNFVWLGVEGEVVLRGLCWGFFGFLFNGFFQFGFYGGVTFVTSYNFTFPVNHMSEKYLLQ